VRNEQRVREDKVFGDGMSMSSFTDRYSIQPISHSIAEDFLLKNHYLAQQGNGFLCKVAHGLFDNALHLIGVITWGGV
jgi:hypothetical protein